MNNLYLITLIITSTSTLLNAYEAWRFLNNNTDSDLKIAMTYTVDPKDKNKNKEIEPHTVTETIPHGKTTKFVLPISQYGNVKAITQLEISNANKSSQKTTIKNPEFKKRHAIISADSKGNYISTAGKNK